MPKRPYTPRPGARRPATWSATTPPVPDWLGTRAKSVWRRVVRELRDAGVLASADRDLIASYSDCVAKLEQVAAEIDRTGVTVEHPVVDRHGVPTGQTVLKANPLLRTHDQLVARVRQLGESLGLGVAARSRQNAATDAAPGLVGNKVLEIRERVRRAREQGGLTPPEGANDDE